MKKQVTGIIFALTIAILSPINVSAAIVNFPLDIYGYTDSITNMWTDDTVDARDNDVAGDVNWFTPQAGANFNNPREVYMGAFQKFNGFSIALGNSPLQVGQTAKFDFFYGAIDNGQVIFKPLEIKDVDGGLAVSNRTYRYTFAPPADWSNAITPHVRADGMYYVKMVCRNNCANGGVNGNFQINQITLQREVILQMLPQNNKCSTQPTRLQCFRHL